MFLGKNLSRVGVDLRRTSLTFFFRKFYIVKFYIALIIPLFESAILSHFESSLKAATSAFADHLKKYRNLAAHKGLSAFGSQKGEFLIEAY